MSQVILVRITFSCGFNMTIIWSIPLLFDISWRDVEDTFAQTLPVLLQSFICMVSTDLLLTLHSAVTAMSTQGADHTTRWPRATRARRRAERGFLCTPKWFDMIVCFNTNHTLWTKHLQDSNINYLKIKLLRFIRSFPDFWRFGNAFSHLFLSIWSNSFHSLSPLAIKNMFSTWQFPTLKSQPFFF